MTSVRFVRKALMVAIVFAATSNVVFAQEAGAALGRRAPLLRCGTRAGHDRHRRGSRHRQACRRRGGGHRAPAERRLRRSPAPSTCPLFLLEGVAILAEVFVLLIVLMK